MSANSGFGYRNFFQKSENPLKCFILGTWRYTIEFQPTHINKCTYTISYDRSEAKRVLYENIVYGVTSEPARPGPAITLFEP